jgi:hypothetical protein
MSEEAAVLETVNPGESETVTEQQVSKIEMTQAELDAIIVKEKAKAYRKAERQLREELAAIPVVKEAEQVKEPSREDFADDKQYIQAMAKFAIANERNAQELAEKQKVADMSHKEFVKRIRDINEQADDIPEFDRDIFESLVVTDNMADVILDSDKGAQIMAYMTLHPDEAMEIHKMGKVAQTKAILKIEQKLETKNDLPKPVGTDKAGSVTVTDPMKMTSVQYRNWRKKQGASWAQ